MDERTYRHLADDTFRRLETLFEDVDPDVVDCERAGDVLTLTLPGKVKCVINPQRPTRQIWLAADAKAVHFGWDEAEGAWVDDRGEGVELFAHVRALVQRHAGVALP